jgi:hypothetical protein
MAHDLPMAFHVSHRYGGDDSNPPFSDFEALLDEVEEAPLDNEHVGVGVVHESGWTIGVYSGWAVVFENVDDLDFAPRHLVVGGDRERVLRLMRAAAEGDVASLELEPWQPGYP